MIYLIKFNLILALLCLLFQVLMHRDTFFGVRRLMLWGIYATAFVLPLCNLQALLTADAAATGMAETYAQHVLPTLEVTAMRVASMGIEQSEPGCGMWFVGMIAIWALVYAIPVVWMTFKLLWQVVYIIYLRCTCVCIKASALHPSFFYFSRPCSPFSFGPWIFVHHDEMDEQTLREVLIHEQAHVRGWHTLDILFSRLVCILFWWNPAAWIMRREVRMNLEFIADKAVCNSLDDSAPSQDATLKAYQYRLLGFAIQKNVATIANNFNVLPLKRRIIMMNLRRTSRTGMVKYALYVPVAAALLLLSNIDSLARTIADNVKNPLIIVDGKRVSPENFKQLNPKQIDHVTVFKETSSVSIYGDDGRDGAVVVTLKEPDIVKAEGIEATEIEQEAFALSDGDTKPIVISKLSSSGLMKDNPLIVVNGKVVTQEEFKNITPDKIESLTVLQDAAATALWGSRGANGVVEIKTKNAPSGKVLKDPEQLPVYPGGEQALYRALNTHVHYPEVAVAHGVTGQVLVNFIVEADGTLSNVHAADVQDLEGHKMTGVAVITYNKNLTPEEAEKALAEEKRAEAVSALKDAAVQAVNSLEERWKPGMQDGQPVRVSFTLPITFMLR